MDSDDDGEAGVRSNIEAGKLKCLLIREEAGDPEASTVENIAENYEPSTKMTLERLGKRMSKFSRETTEPSKMEETAIKIDDIATSVGARCRRSKPQEQTKKNTQKTPLAT